jgi:hypothetical protein
LIMGMSRGQFYSLFLVLGGAILIRVAEAKVKKRRK